MGGKVFLVRFSGITLLLKYNNKLNGVKLFVTKFPIKMKQLSTNFEILSHLYYYLGFVCQQPKKPIWGPTAKISETFLILFGIWVYNGYLIIFIFW